MKKVFIAAFVSLALGSFAFAGEEIQLAAAIGAGDNVTVPNPAADTGTKVEGADIADIDGAVTSATTPGMGKMVIIGVLAAGAIAGLASSGGGSSTSNH